MTQTTYEKIYKEEYEAIYLDIVNQSDVTESGKDWKPTKEDKEIMHNLATERAKKRIIIPEKFPHKYLI